MTDVVLNFGKAVPKADPGSYPSTLVGLDTFLIGEGTADAKTLLRWDFKLTGTEDPDQPGFEIILDGISSLATGPKSKMRAWVTALNGKPLDTGVTLASLRKLLVGRECLVVVAVNDDGYSKVQDVIAPMRRPVAAPAASKPDIDAVQRASDQHDLQEGDGEPDPLPF